MSALAIYDVVCPWCFARVGEPCYYLGRELAEPHNERWARLATVIAEQNARRFD